MAELRDIEQIINAAVDRALIAFLRYSPGIRRGQQYRDIWVTTSPTPCRFCIAIASLSEIVNVQPGGPFPVPIWVDVPYNSAIDITYAAEAHAHPNCQCQRETVFILR